MGGPGERLEAPELFFPGVGVTLSQAWGLGGGLGWARLPGVGRGPWGK